MDSWPPQLLSCFTWKLLLWEEGRGEGRGEEGGVVWSVYRDSYFKQHISQSAASTYWSTTGFGLYILAIISTLIPHTSPHTSHAHIHTFARFIIVAGDVEMEHVPQCTTGRVFCTIKFHLRLVSETHSPINKTRGLMTVLKSFVSWCDSWEISHYHMGKWMLTHVKQAIVLRCCGVELGISQEFLLLSCDKHMPQQDHKHSN